MKKSPLKILFSGALAIATLILCWACQKEQYPDDNCDAQIAASKEMESYIINGFQMQSALDAMQKEFDKVDFTTLKFEKGEDGKMVMHLPINNTTFEQQLLLFNQSKDALTHKYPQLASFSEDRQAQIIRACFKQSVSVNTALLELNINTFAASKAILEDYESSLLFLQQWVRSSNYVEAVIVVYRDGSSSIYIDPRNDATTSYYPPLQHVEGTDLFYYPAGGSNSPILFIGHTHQSGPDPSQVDKQTAIDGLKETIYYNGNFYPYDKNGRY